MRRLQGGAGRDRAIPRTQEVPHWPDWQPVESDDPLGIDDVVVRRLERVHWSVRIASTAVAFDSSDPNVQGVLGCVQRELACVY